MFFLSLIKESWGSHWKSEWFAYFHTASKNGAETDLFMLGTTVPSKHKSGKLQVVHTVSSVMTKTIKKLKGCVCLFVYGLSF